jgi:hypothetical protein
MFTVRISENAIAQMAPVIALTIPVFPPTFPVIPAKVGIQ